MSDVLRLKEVKLIVRNFTKEYDGDWGRLKATIEGIDRRDEEKKVATAKVHLIIQDEWVGEIGELAFIGSRNLWKVTALHASLVRRFAFCGCRSMTEAVLPAAFIIDLDSFSCCDSLINVSLPNATSIGKGSFNSCYALCHVTLAPTVDVAKYTFHASLSLEVLATCAGFELDTGDTNTYGRLDPTVAITRYLKGLCAKDRQQRDVFLTYNIMLALCNHHIDKKTGKKTGDIRAWPQKHDRLANFLLDNEDAARHILSYFGMKWGKNDNRNASKQRLLELGLQKKALRAEMNDEYETYWSVKVDEKGVVAEGEMPTPD
mmetsp:Transcript_1150/g.2117  ORF Transcript_1150/g.2117 Transcript_1150/m.2117 type:complete len:318 (-) Transcript_1150:28-981(-)